MSEEEVIIPDLNWNRPYKNFVAFAILSYAKTQQDRDFIFTINGPRGVGKSTLGAGYAKTYFENCLGLPFTKTKLKQSLVKPQEIQEEILNPEHEFWPIVLDEAVMSAYVGDYAKSDVKDLVKLFTICRDKHRPICLISPGADDITTRLRNFAVYRLSVKARGIAVLFTKDLSEAASKDPFHLEAMPKYEGVYDENTPVSDIVKRLRKHPCFKDVIDFPPLPKEVEGWYKEQREVIAYGDKTHSKDDDIAGNIFVNLQNKLDAVREKKALTLDYFYNELCTDVATKKQLLGLNVFHRAVKKARTAYLSSAALSEANSLENSGTSL